MGAYDMTCYDEEAAAAEHPPTQRVSICRMHDEEGADRRYMELVAEGWEDCGSTRWWYELQAPPADIDTDTDTDTKEA